MFVQKGDKLFFFQKLSRFIYFLSRFIDVTFLCKNSLGMRFCILHGFGYYFCKQSVFLSWCWSKHWLNTTLQWLGDQWLCDVTATLRLLGDQWFCDVTAFWLRGPLWWSTEFLSVGQPSNIWSWGVQNQTTEKSIWRFLSFY